MCFISSLLTLHQTRCRALSHVRQSPDKTIRYIKRNVISF
ncbi:hypothetical protein HMPREF0880_02451 [Yokenella regensburgei ATCC 43003]|nr:hypothetical protein HMPREF0880_02451 [Yokenella regensburgei ATCC 43003]